MSSNQPILEEDLHAYVDDLLPPGRRQRVQEYLDTHPEAARQVNALRHQRDSLRAALGPIANEPLPPRLNLRRMVENRQRHRFHMPRLAAAASIVALTVGSIGGWSLRGAVQESPTAGIAALAREASASYMVYASDPVRPVEIGADRQAELVSWVSSRIRRPVTVPDLTQSGYRFIGGRVVATPHGPAGMLLYDDGKGARLAMVMRPMAIDHDTPMVENTNNGLGGYTWADKGVGFSLVSTRSSNLHPLADEARRQIEAKLHS